MEEKELNLNEEEIAENEIVEANPEYDYETYEDDEEESESSLGAVLAGAAVAGTALVGGLVLKKYGPRIKSWAKDKHQKHLAKKDQRAIAYLAERNITGEEIDKIRAKKASEDLPVEKIPVEKVEKTDEKKETKNKK